MTRAFLGEHANVNETDEDVYARDQARDRRRDRAAPTVKGQTGRRGEGEQAPRLQPDRGLHRQALELEGRCAMNEQEWNEMRQRKAEVVRAMYVPLEPGQTLVFRPDDHSSAPRWCRAGQQNAPCPP